MNRGAPRARRRLRLAARRGRRRPGPQPRRRLPAGRPASRLHLRGSRANSRSCRIGSELARVSLARLSLARIASMTSHGAASPGAPRSVRSQAPGRAHAPATALVLFGGLQGTPGASASRCLRNGGLPVAHQYDGLRPAALRQLSTSVVRRNLSTPELFANESPSNRHLWDVGSRWRHASLRLLRLLWARLLAALPWPGVAFCSTSRHWLLRSSMLQLESESGLAARPPPEGAGGDNIAHTGRHSGRQ